jgi:hypothetical protein
MVGRLRAKELFMTLSCLIKDRYKGVAGVVILVLGVGLTMTACTPTAKDGTQPVVTVYASPT